MRRLPSRCRPTRGAFDLASVEAAGADLHLDDLAFRSDDARDLQIRLPGASRLVVGVRDVVAERHALAAGVAPAAIDSHGLFLHQFDARHFSAIALAVTGLENACVATGPLGIARTDLLKELVGRFTLLDVTTGQAPRVQRSGRRVFPLEVGPSSDPGGCVASGPWPSTIPGWSVTEVDAGRARLLLDDRDGLLRAALHGLQPPTQDFRVELSTPWGQAWVFGPEDASQRVTGSAGDLCLLATQRVHRADTDLVATGADADLWLRIAQCFAGPPGPGRARR